MRAIERCSTSARRANLDDIKNLWPKSWAISIEIWCSGMHSIRDPESCLRLKAPMDPVVFIYTSMRSVLLSG